MYTYIYIYIHSVITPGTSNQRDTSRLPEVATRILSPAADLAGHFPQVPVDTEDYGADF